MSGLHGRMPYTTAFERAMGTGMIIQSATSIDDGFRSKLDAFIDRYESVLSRFRADFAGDRNGRILAWRLV